MKSVGKAANKMIEEVREAILEVAEQYKKLGAEVEECSVDIGEKAIADYYIISCAEASSSIASASFASSRSSGS